MTIAAESVGQLLDSIEDAVDGLRDLEAVHLAAADDVVSYVDPPVLTGRLASTVRAEADAVGFRVLAGGPEAPYGPIVHARDPFLDRAAEQREQAATDLYTDHVQQLLDDIQGA